MPTKRNILSALTRAELLAFVDQLELEVSDRRVREKIIDALASSRRARLPEFLESLSRDRLRDLCRTVGVGDGGVSKVALVERIVG
jgi:hypothetical protein